MATSGQIIILNGDAPPTPPEGTITIYTKVDGGICYKTGAGTEHLFVTASGGGYDHGLTTGLLDDDHTQYHTDARGDLRYYTQDQVDATISGVASTLVVVDKTSSTALTGTELNGLYTITNDGAGGEVILTWPSLVTGQECTFYVNDAQYLQIKANSGGKIRSGPLCTAVDGYVRSNTVGNWIRLKSMPDELVVTEHGGTWDYSSSVDSYTVLLMHMDGIDDAQVFTDSGAGANSPHTITPVANVKTENTQKKFGATSAYFDGIGDYITTPASADWDFGGDNFTVDFWIYHLQGGTGAADYIYGCGRHGGTCFHIGISNDISCGDHGRITAHIFSSSYLVNLGYTFTASDEWAHIAFVRNGNDFDLYINGVSQDNGIYSGDAFPTGEIPVIGAGQTGIYITDIDHYFKGYIDELRISKGIVRWTANFTPPTEAY